MFDDQPILNNNSQIPGNLPLGEPQDMFENVDTSNIPPLPEGPRSGVSSALDAGILKPKPSLNSQNQMVSMDQNTIKEPTFSRGIMSVVLFAIIGAVLLGTGWYLYKIFTKKDIPIVAPVTNLPSPTVVEKEKVVSEEEPVSVLESGIVTSSEDSIDQEILVGETPDTDGDGIKDIREKELGTDSNNWDTDKDDLSDGEELFIWHTDPLKMDTDGDSYSDSKEIRAGYNPTGPGKIGELQKNISSSTVSSSVKTDISTSSSTSSATSTSAVINSPIISTF